MDFVICIKFSEIDMVLLQSIKLKYKSSKYVAKLMIMISNVDETDEQETI